MDQSFKLANLVVPGVDAAMEAGKLLEDLPVLWEETDLSERRKVLMAMLEAVYFDTVEEKSVVAIRPKPAFRPIFEVATTREGSGIVLINQTPQTHIESGASGLCFWWRRRRAYLLGSASLSEVIYPWQRNNMRSRQTAYMRIDLTLQGGL